VTNVQPLDENLLRQLCTTAPDEFVAVRNDIVKRLKKDGDREQADAIATLRRPSWVDWALNVAAVQNGDVVDAFGAAAADMRDAQRSTLAGQSGVNVRASIAELRERSSALVRVANDVLVARGRHAALPELTERVASVAADEGATAQLRAGALGAADADDAAGFGSIDESSVSDRDRPAPPRAKPPSRRQPTPASDGPEPDRRSQEERRRLERDMKDLERTIASTGRELGRAETAVRHAEAGVEAAAEKVAEATVALEQARQRLADVESDRNDIAGRAEAAGAELARVHAALEGLGG
jgi:hypothetical protein